MKFLNRPLEALAVTQNFGENKACIPINGGKLIGCDGLNPPQGYKSIYSNMNGHNGTDFMAFNGMKLFSCLEGIVEEVVDEEARGKGLGIVSTKKYYCDEVEKDVYWKIRYWHLKDFNVKKGDIVKAGQLIGRCDNTGYSSGDHLHLEAKPVEYKIKKGVITGLKNILQNNGYFGAINVLPYIKDEIIFFSRNLKYGYIGQDVKQLQTILKEKGFFDKNTTCSTFYGSKTKDAVRSFQEFYAKEILHPLGLKEGTGNFMESTRAFLNQLVG